MVDFNPHLSYIYSKIFDIRHWIGQLIYVVDAGESGAERIRRQHLFVFKIPDLGALFIEETKENSRN